MRSDFSRRSFLGALSLGLFALPGFRRSAAAQPLRLSHPEPREGIDASAVLTADRLRKEGFDDQVVEAFDMVRQIPEIADGLACYCGCALLGNRSLLTCYHEGGMARGCLICQGEGRLAFGRWKEGQSLEQIRRAIDARYAV